MVGPLENCFENYTKKQSLEPQMGVQMGQGYKTLLSLFLLINVLFGKMNSLISFRTPQRKELAKNYT